MIQAYNYASTSSTLEEVEEETNNTNVLVVRWGIDMEAVNENQQQHHPGETVLLIQRCLASILMVSILSSSLTFSEDKQLLVEEGVVKEGEEVADKEDETIYQIDNDNASKKALTDVQVGAVVVVVENNSGNEEVAVVEKEEEFKKEQVVDEPEDVESITTCNTTISSRVSLLMQYSEDEEEMEGEGEGEEAEAEVEKTSPAAVTEKDDNNISPEATENVELNKTNSSKEEVVVVEEEEEYDDDDDWSYNHKKMLKLNHEWEWKKPLPTSTSTRSTGILYKQTTTKPTVTSTTTTRPMMSMAEKKAMAMKMMEEW